MEKANLIIIIIISSISIISLTQEAFLKSSLGKPKLKVQT
jgi:hypothetical protein